MTDTKREREGMCGSEAKFLVTQQDLLPLFSLLGHFPSLSLSSDSQRVLHYPPPTQPDPETPNYLSPSLGATLVSQLMSARSKEKNSMTEARHHLQAPLIFPRVWMLKEEVPCLPPLFTHQRNGRGRTKTYKNKKKSCVCV